jgi:hypothetical protein
MPYQKHQGLVLNLLLTTEECKSNGFGGKSGMDEVCGCNCKCGSTLGLLFANDLGLLGASIHAAIQRGHMYLVYGKRSLFQNKKMKVIESTTRNFQAASETCHMALRDLLDQPNSSYKENGWLIPNIAEYYIVESSFANRESLKTENDAVQNILFSWMTTHTINAFGVARMMHLLNYNPVDLVRQDKKFHRFLRQMIQKELNPSTQSNFHEIAIYHENRNDLLYFTSVIVLFLDFIGAQREDYLLLRRLIGWDSQSDTEMNLTFPEANRDNLSVLNRFDSQFSETY